MISLPIKIMAQNINSGLLRLEYGRSETHRPNSDGDVKSFHLSRITEHALLFITVGWGSECTPCRVGASGWLACIRPPNNVPWQPELPSEIAEALRYTNKDIL